MTMIKPIGAHPHEGRGGVTSVIWSYGGESRTMAYDRLDHLCILRRQPRLLRGPDGQRSARSNF